MPKERLKSPRSRLFCALDLPGTVVGGLAAWQAGEVTDPALRPVAPEALHVTLVFLGWTRDRDIPAVAEVLTTLPRHPVRVALADPVPIPSKGREKRLFALAADAPAALPLQAELARELAEARLHQPEKWPFWPHVTVARVRKDKARKGRYRPVERSPGPLPSELREPFGAVRITLYRSALRPAGAEYTPLAQVELPDGEGQGRR